MIRIRVLCQGINTTKVPILKASCSSDDLTEARLEIDHVTHATFGNYILD